MAIKGAVTISVDKLAATIQEYLKGFGDEADYALEMGARTAAEKAVSTLKATSPRFSSATQNRTNRKGTKRRTRGKYARGWRAKTEGLGGSHLYIIHNATDYQLTHLLEKGHALRQGGRSPAIVHIKPVEQAAIKDFEDYIERFLI